MIMLELVVCSEQSHQLSSSVAADILHFSYNHVWQPYNKHTVDHDYVGAWRPQKLPH